MNAPSIVKLDRKLSRAVELGKGVRLEPADIDLLVALGLFNITHPAKAAYLKEQTQCRSAKRQSISGENIGSASMNSPMEADEAPTSMSGGTTPPRDVNAARQRGPQTKRLQS